MADNPFKREVDTLVAQHERKISTDLYSERTARCEEAQRVVQASFDRELQAKKRELRELEAAATATAEALRLHAEQHRLSCAAALMKAAFDAGDANSLVNLVKRWRQEPSRAGTTALQARCLELDKQAQQQLGEELHWTVLAQAFIDDVLVTHPDAVVALSAGAHGAMDAAYHFMHAPSPVAAQQFLETLDHSTVIAAGGASYEAEPRHLRYHELRRQHATQGDIARACGAYEQEVKQAYQREYEQRVAAERAAAAQEQPSLVGRAIQWMGAR